MGWAIIDALAVVIIGLVVAMAAGSDGGANAPTAEGARARRHRSTTTSTVAVGPASGASATGAGSAKGGAGSGPPTNGSGSGASSTTTSTTTAVTTTTTSPTSAGILRFEAPETVRCTGTAGTTLAVVTVSVVRTDTYYLRWGLDGVGIHHPHGAFFGTHSLPIKCASDGVTIALTASPIATGEPQLSVERTVTVLHTGIAGG